MYVYTYVYIYFPYTNIYVLKSPENFKNLIVVFAPLAPKRERERKCVCGSLVKKNPFFCESLSLKSPENFRNLLVVVAS